MFSRMIQESKPDGLGERLRALPAFTPPPGGWGRMDARLAARRRRFVAAGSGLAMAASVFVAIGLLALRPDAIPGNAGLGAGAAKATEVSQLIRRSQALERELAGARPQVAVWTSGRDRRVGSIEQRLRMVDAQLNFADPESAEPLWRERVRLLNTLVELHQPDTQAPALQYASYQY